MSSEDLYERLKKYEFNKTEPETLRELVKSALKKGNIVRNRMRKFRRLVEDVRAAFERERLIRTIKVSPDKVSKYRNAYTVGVDGSFQCVGGVGGIWYVPVSCSTIIFERGLSSQPIALIAARIEEINENEYPNVRGEASIRMLQVETKAINECLSKMDKNRKNIIFIDGPIVDPPYYSEEKYIQYRCDIISRCLQNNVLLIGCVKKAYGKPFINYVTRNILKDETERERIKQFTSDVHLINYIFTRLYFDKIEGTLATAPAEISNEDSVHQAYLKNGIRVFSVFMQKDPLSNPIRLDIPLKTDSQNIAETITEEVIKAVYAWSYPGYNIPLPVVLAHNKCTIRRGCAEVLYEEIITRSVGSDPFDNIIKTKLGG